MTDREGNDDNRPAPTRKSYQAPKLVPWGTLHDITVTVGVAGNSDGAMKSPNKTR